MKMTPHFGFSKFYVMLSPEINLYGIAHVKVHFIPPMKICLNYRLCTMCNWSQQIIDLKNITYFSFSMINSFIQFMVAEISDNLTIHFMILWMLCQEDSYWSNRPQTSIAPNRIIQPLWLVLYSLDCCNSPNNHFLL